MAITLAKSILVVLDCYGEYGRSYTNVEKYEICRTCTPRMAGDPLASEVASNKYPAQTDWYWSLYVEDCKRAGHHRERKVHTDVDELDPLEAKRVSQLHGEARRAFKALGYHPGGSVYLIADGKQEDLDATVAELRTEFDKANAEMKVAKADFSLRIVEINPGASHEETMRSIRRDVDAAVDTLMAAIRAGDVEGLRKAVRSTRDVATLLAGDARKTVSDLGSYAGKVADRLRDAAKRSDTNADSIIADAKLGAQRFASILAGLDEPEGEESSGGGEEPPGASMAAQS